MIGYDDLPTVNVYHRCADFAAGSIFPERGAEPAYWWARVDAGDWRVWLRGVADLERPALEARIRRVARLELTAASAARDAQDARAEAPDV